MYIYIYFNYCMHLTPALNVLAKLKGVLSSIVVLCLSAWVQRKAWQPNVGMFLFLFLFVCWGGNASRLGPLSKTIKKRNVL